ncbi:MAG: BamA/TamA family outer membrane protein [Deltaproteobacteria bacterium]|nr:BamA/TamA family outer membrane protein [Deltaproteobacteria bacterium]
MQALASMLWVLAVAADPAAPQDSLFGRPIASIAIEAPSIGDESEVRAALELEVGAALERRALRRAVKRLYLLEQLADVQVWASPSGDAVALRVVLVPAQVVRRIEIAGASQVSPDLVRSSLGIAVGDRFDGVDPQVLTTAVRAAYARRGFPSAEVSIRVDRDATSQAVALWIEIREGSPTMVRRMRLDADTARARIDLRDWTEIRPGAVYNAQQVNEALLALQLRDRKRGFLDARFDPPRVDLRTDGQVDVAIGYRRGPRYRVSFRGARALPPALLRQEIDFDGEQALDADLLAHWQGLVTAVYRRAGYPSARVQAGVGADADRDCRRLVFTIDEGPRAVLDRIEVRDAAGIAPARLAEAARAAVADRYADQSAISHVDPGDVEALLSTPAGRPRSRGGIEYPMSWLGVVDGERVYDEDAYREAANAIEDVYLANGFLSARVRGPRPRWSNDGRTVDAVYKADEGVRTDVRAIRFRGNRAREASQLLDSLGFVPGSPLDLGQVEQARLALIKQYADSGFAFIRVFDDVEYDAARTSALVSYDLVEGPQVTIGRILVQGNERTAAPVVLDRMVVQPGDLYSERALEESRQSMLGLGLFTSVILTLVDADVPEEHKDLLVEVREAAPRAFEVNLGASVEDGPRASVLLEHRNILGVGLGARGRLKLNYPKLTYFTVADPVVRSDLEQRFDLEYPTLDPRLRELMFTEGQALFTFEYPKVFAIPFDTSLRSTLLALRENRSSFTLNKVGLVLGLDLRLVRWLTLGSAIEIEGSDFLCYAGIVEGRYRTCGTEDAPLTRRQDNGQLGQLTLRQEAAIDRRDNQFRPHSGYHVIAGADLALGAGQLYGEYERGKQRAPPTQVSSNFVKLAVNAAGYLPLTHALTLAIQARSGNIFGLSDREHVPLYKKFYLGGTGSVRGFDEDRVLPADAVSSLKSELAAGTVDSTSGILEGSSSGGRFYWNLRSELRFPVSRDVDLGVFIDTGELVESASDLDLSQFSAGIGAGARWNTPVGPIAFDVGWALKDPALELKESLAGAGGGWDPQNRTRVHLSIGYF